MSYDIPLFDLNFDLAEQNAVIETLRSKWISMGPKTEEFEDKFADMLGINHALATSNCTVALHLAMIAAGIKKDDEVICPSMTFVATINAIRYLGAKPVFADIKSYEDLNIDPEDISKKITARTKAIVVMHYAGFSCDMNEIMNIAKTHNLLVIEDACHGPLSEYGEKKLGTIGDIGCFSFFSNKNISTGEGGMLVTNNSKFFEKVKLLRSHGMTSLSYERSKGHSTGYDVNGLGYNYRIDDIRSSIGIVQLSKLPNDLKKRAKLRLTYIKRFSSIDEIILPFKNYNNFSSNYIFPIVLKDSNYINRDNLRTYLKNKGIQTSVHYPPAHKFSIYNKSNSKLPITEYVADNIISLPFHSKINKEEIGYLIDKIYKYFK